MKTSKSHWTKRIAALAAISLIAGNVTNAMADNESINRYKVDFSYQGIYYQILSESEHTVAVCQPYDINFAGAPNQPKKTPYLREDIGDNGFLMSYGLVGQIVEIPETVYDENGISYTVTDLASGAINWLWMGMLVLPSTLERLNGGIGALQGLSAIYLPDNLKEIDGIDYCEELTSLQIPRKVESIKNYSLEGCGFEFIYLPPSVKTLENEVLSRCQSLRTALLSGVETMGEECFSECPSFGWANLPETLRSMGEGCFNDCETLALVSLPWSEIDMKECFNGCTSISQIEVLAIEPYPFPETCFRDVDRSKCTLVVPEGSEEKYEAADGWKDFYRIEGTLPAISNTNVNAVQANDFRVLGGKGSIRIINSSETAVDIYSLSGEKMASTNKAGISEISLPTGIYIASSPFSSRKVAVN